MNSAAVRFLLSATSFPNLRCRGFLIHYFFFFLKKKKKKKNKTGKRAAKIVSFNPEGDDRYEVLAALICFTLSHSDQIARMVALPAPEKTPGRHFGEILRGFPFRPGYRARPLRLRLGGGLHHFAGVRLPRAIQTLDLALS